MREFEDTYDISTLNNANDKANLESLIRNRILIEKIDKEIGKLTDSDDVISAVANIKRLSDVKTDLVDKSLQLERQLGIDRKSRKKDNETSAAEYIIHIKQAAQEFLEKRLVKVFCPKCKILVFRFSPAYNHTEFRIGAQCPQCNKFVTAHRKERDVFYDLESRDVAWRKRYPIEVIAPKENKETIISTDLSSEMSIQDGIDFEDLE